MSETEFWLRFRRVWLCIGGLIKRYKIHNDSDDETEFWVHLHGQINELNNILSIKVGYDQPVEESDTQ